MLFFVSREKSQFSSLQDIVFIQERDLHGLIEHDDRRFVSVSDKLI